MKGKLWVWGAVLALAAACPGCGLILAKAPFDATGNYRGKWTGTVKGDPDTLSCTASFSFEQDDLWKIFQGAVLNGDTVLNFTCLSTLDRLGAIGLPGLASMEVSGFVAQDGGVNFGGSTLEGDVKMTFALTGEGSDKDEDGKMDRLGGKWTLVIDQPDYPRITITGNVQADAL